MSTKINRICKKTIVGDAIQFDFSNGKSLVANFQELPEQIQIQLAMHGLSQKIGDSYASAETVQDAIESATEVYNQLKAGEWNAKRSGGTSIVIEAISREHKLPVDRAAAVFNELDDEKKKAIAKHPAIVKMVQVIKLERIEAERKAGSGQATKEQDDALAIFLKPQAA